MSGTPRVEPIAVEPAGTVFWKLGLPNTWLKPPPDAIQPFSRLGWFWHSTGGLVLSTPKPVTAFVHRYVPPTPVTSGSDAGHPTVGNGNVFGWSTGVLELFADPPSPELASTVTPFVAAETNACRRFCRDWVLANASSADPKLCEITVASRWSTMYCSASIIAGKPCKPSVSAGLVVTLRMFAPGAI